MSRVPDLVCVGHIVQETIHFPYVIRGPVLGGPPAYCSVAAARQGTSVGMVTRIGQDMPEELLIPLREAGVDMRGIVLGGVTTASKLIYDRDGNKEIRYPAKAAPIKAEDVPKAYRGCQMIYVCTMDNDVLPEDIAAMTALGKASAVDLGGYGGVHMSKSNRDAAGSLSDLARGVARHFDIVKASDEDARTIFGWDDDDESADTLLACGPSVVVITLGSKGALVRTREGWGLVPPLPCDAVDTTGGGDTFMAGFLSEYLRSGDPAESAMWGAVTAACVIEKSGGVVAERMPSRDDVKARVEHWKGKSQWKKSELQSSGAEA